MIGQLLNDRYRLDKVLGRGGMGVIYQAHDELLDRSVAVKMMSDAGLGSEGKTRLLNEARAAAQLIHPNIVSVFDAGETGSTPFIVMELVDGHTLDEEPPLDLDATYRVAVQICTGLQEAHAHNIIHRDLKPENVLVTHSGTAKLTDFGLARSLASRMTSEGTIVGTVFYMAPEMMLGQEVDGRADLYALGVMLYELVAGRLPFIADNPLGVISQHIHAPVVPPGAYRPDIPPALESVILKLLAKDPNERYPDARAAQEALLAAQRAGWTADDGSDRAAEDVGDLLEKLARGRLVGRRSEIDALHLLWKNAMLGTAQLALVSGEPGVGKTRLANELIVYMRLSGASTLRGGCYEYEAGTPYLPFVEMLQTWVRRQNDEELARRVGDLAPELARLAPELESRMGPLVQNPSLPAAEERLRLFDAVARLFERLSQNTGLLFFIDDIHWADQGSLALLNYLLRYLRSSRVMALACYREVELDRSHPFTNTLADWGRERLANRVMIGRLASDDVNRLLAGLFGMESMSPEFTAAIYKETEGNPFFIEEVIKALIQQGQIYRQNGRWDRRQISDLAIPQSIKEAIGRRLDRQSPECINLLHTAAVLGKRFSFNELASSADEPEAKLLDMLDSAERAQLVRPEEQDNFTFTHDKIREVLYEELNPIRRRRLHLRIAQGLERLFQLEPEKMNCKRCEREAQTLAYHYIEGGNLEQGLVYSTLAARQARNVLALEDAGLFYRHAVDCAEALEREDKAYELYVEIGHLDLQCGSYDDAVGVFQKALELAPDRSEKASVEAHLGQAYAQMGDERGIQHLKSAIRDLDPSGQPAELGLAYAQLGRFYHYRRQFDQAIEVLEKALKIVEPLQDGEALTNIYGYLSGAYQQLGRWETSMEWANRAVELGEKTGYLPAIALGYEFLAEDYYATGRWRKSLEYSQLDYEYGQRIGSQSRVAWALSARANSLFGLGEIEQAVQAANETLAIVERTGEHRLGVLVRTVLVRSYAIMDRMDQARQELERMVSRAEATNQGQLWNWTFDNWALVAVLSEQWEEVLEVSRRSEEILGFPTAGPATMAAIALDRREAVETWREFWEKMQGKLELELPMNTGDINFFLALVYSYLGKVEAAGRSFDLAVQSYAASESRLAQGQTLMFRAMYHQTLGDAKAARQDAQAALDLLRACSAALFIKKVEPMLR